MKKFEDDYKSFDQNYETIRTILENSCDQGQDLASVDFLFSKPSQLCLKTFTSLEKFYSHLRVHTNEKPFPCSIKGCNMSFN